MALIPLERSYLFRSLLTERVNLPDLWLFGKREGVEGCHLLKPRAEITFKMTLLSIFLLIILKLPVTSANELCLLASDKENLLTDLSQPSSQRLLLDTQLVDIHSARLIKEVRVIDEVFLGRLVEGVEGTVVAHVSVLGSLLALVAVVRVGLLEIIDNALLNGGLHLDLLFFERSEGELQVDLGLKRPRCSIVEEPLSLLIDEEF